MGSAAEAVLGGARSVLARQARRGERGTQEPADRVEAGTAAVALGTDGMLVPDDGTKTRFVLPEHDPFMAWAQRAAIFKDAHHPAAAKRYLNWWLSKRTQSDFFMWSVRTDGPRTRATGPSGTTPTPTSTASIASWPTAPSPSASGSN